MDPARAAGRRLGAEGRRVKRTLITAAALYLLYERQKRVERRLKLWKLRTEGDLRHWLSGTTDQLTEFTEGFDRDYYRWAERVIKQIERAFKEGAK